jgi:muramoyltetrapeptide carboxypeptidase
MLTATLGTPWFPRLDGSLLFLEDVNEPLYRIDRMLTQLRLSGRVRRVKGMILGHLEAAPDGDAASRRLMQWGMRGEARRIMAWNLPCGHGRPNLTIPLGALARLDPEAAALIVDDEAPEV